MITFEHTEVVGFDHAIRGMRNPLESWYKSDSEYLCKKCNQQNTCEKASNKYIIGDNDLSLMLKLAKAGSEHAKYRRMIVLYCDIKAPLYWWKEFDTYKIGTVANSCSTMHTIHKKTFELEDFSYEHVSDDIMDHSWIEDDFSIGEYADQQHISRPIDVLKSVIKILNKNQALDLASKDKRYWWNMVQLLPSSYNQRRTVMMNYEVLSNVYKQREGHKLDEWNQFREWIDTLPYSEIITLKGEIKDE